MIENSFLCNVIIKTFTQKLLCLKGWKGFPWEPINKKESLRNGVFPIQGEIKVKLLYEKQPEIIFQLERNETENYEDQKHRIGKKRNGKRRGK